jgi:preprotein translocase subunit SecA
MDAEDPRPVIETIVDDFIDAVVERTLDTTQVPEPAQRSEFLGQLENVFMFPFAHESSGAETAEEIRTHAKERAREALRAREDLLARDLGNPDLVREFEKFILLQVIDEKWMDHLHELDSLKEGIHYRAYAQKDPLVEYKREAFGLFADLNERVDRDALYAMFHARVAAAPRAAADLSRARAVHREAAPVAAGPAAATTTPLGTPAAPVAAPPAGSPPMGATEATSRVLRGSVSHQPVVRTEEKVGRNDPCPCGSGKKYKKCHGISS